MYIKVSVVPGAKKERVTNTGEHRYHIEVREPAARNLANKRVLELIAREYHVRTKDVRLISGHRSPTKVISLDTTP